MNSIAYTQGRKAAEMGVKLEDSALKNLNPNSERYDQFIAGYDSFSLAENQDAKDCACHELGSQCDVCDDDV